MKKSVIIIGGGGHATVLLDIIQELKLPIKGYISLKKESDLDAPYLGDDSYLDNLELINSCVLVNGLGSIHLPYKRKEVFLKYKNMGYDFCTLVHPKAIVSKKAEIREGAQIMVGCIIQTKCVINANVIVNTGSCIDHHTTIEDHCHVAPGVTICGNVIVGHTSHIGPKATIIQNIKVSEETFIPAHRLVKE